MARFYAEWYSGGRLFRSPTFGKLEDLREYLDNIGEPGAAIYADF